VEKKFPYKLEDVLKASRFVQKQRYWEGYDRNNKLVGYVMISNDWTKHLIGYSSKPLNTLIGMDTKGTITGIKIISYWEPIFMIGIKDSDYHKFLQQYVGKNIDDSITVGKEITMDAITGATVTAVVQNATNLGTTRSVAAIVGLSKKAGVVAKRAGKVSLKYETLSWEQLFTTEALKTIRITTKDLEMKGEEDIYLELNAGMMTPPSIGRNLLGDKFYKDIMNEIKEGESGLFICTTRGSFKGVGFAYGGIFGTINVEQDGKIFVFTTDEYENVTHLYAKGVPPVSETGVFIIRGKNKEIFDQTRPFKLHITLPYYVGGKKAYKTFTMEYKLPDRFIK
jgi:NosR/NirI family nitrous oxide reductase transcriptional regulator